MNQTALYIPHFVENDHKYFHPDTGDELPSVNRILEAVGIKKKYDGDPIYTEIGKAAAEAISLDIHGVLDEDSVDALVRPRLNGFRRFWVDKAFVPLLTEFALYSPITRIAGRFDVYGTIDNENWLIDIKCQQQVKNYETDCQLAGYQALCLANGIGVEKRAALQIDRDGNYKLIPYEFDAMALWDAVMTLWRRKQQ